ncbi:cytochrome P450 [Gilbertella persicaria]|uniref:cytochrome P450 n=1 Tax=Gilbertella persicaria TaxID=101096 RepID=UPI002220A558|nr:cytochrome P450 [Gilbertella persicaria]KAI8056335.1 cytochrome P450 [Gilbertella persicaria]
MGCVQSIEKVEQAVKLISKTNLDKIGIIIVVALLAYVILNIVQNALFGPLRDVPGPFLTKFINIPYFILDLPLGTYYQKLKSFHETYGDLVRLGPRTISIADKTMIRQILVHEDLPKSSVYEMLQKNRGMSLFSTTDSNWHRQRRRIISPAFSIKYLKSLETFMTSAAVLLVNKIDHDITKNQDSDGFGIIDIWSLLQCLAIDVIGEAAFGESFKMIQDPTHFVPPAIKEEIQSGAINAMYPLLGKLILKNSGGTDPKLTNFMSTIIHNRLNSKEKKREDILQILIDAHKDYNECLTVEAIISETVLFLIAGSETTSNTLGFAIFELLNKPETLKSLYREIDNIPLEKNQTVFNYEQVKNLPYLNSVINETMRIDSMAAGGLERTTKKTVVLGNRLALPEGVEIICNVYHVQTDEKHWPDPFKFKPERWISYENEENSLDAFFPFSAGSRNCVGKNFALQEMKISLATLLKYFEIESIEQEMKDALNRRVFITLGMEKNSFKIKMKRK